jgi:hypothetical protein
MHGVSTAAALASSPSSNAAGKKSQAKSDGSHNTNAKSNETATTKGGAASSKTSLLDKAVRYLLAPQRRPLARRLPCRLLRASVVHVPRGLRAHPRLAVPVLVAASAIFSESCAAFPFRVERRVGAVDGTWEQWDGE